MATYTVKNSPVKWGGTIIPIGGSIELAEDNTEGLTQFLELTAEQPKAKEPTLNVAETLKLVAAAETVEALAALAEGETRKGVTDAITKRRAEFGQK